MNVGVLNGAVETFETVPIDCFVESLDGKSYKIAAFTMTRVTGNMPHLKRLEFSPVRTPTNC